MYFNQEKYLMLSAQGLSLSLCCWNDDDLKKIKKLEKQANF